MSYNQTFGVLENEILEAQTDLEDMDTILQRCIRSLRKAIEITCDVFGYDIIQFNCIYGYYIFQKGSEYIEIKTDESIYTKFIYGWADKDTPSDAVAYMDLVEMVTEKIRLEIELEPSDNDFIKEFLRIME